MSGVLQRGLCHVFCSVDCVTCSEVDSVRVLDVGGGGCVCVCVCVCVCAVSYTHLTLPTS